MPPGVPVLVAPAKNALITDYTPQFDWTASAFADLYEIQVATDNSFAAPAIDQSNTVPYAFTPEGLLDVNTEYYWHVRAYNYIGDASAWSTIRSFSTTILPPNSVAPGSVDLGTPGQLDNKRPTFSWDAVTGAGSYFLEISKVQNFTSKVLTATATGTTYMPTKDLPAETTLYWRVTANPIKGAYGPSAPSQVRAFKTGNPASVPVLSLPKNNATVTSLTPLLVWKKSTLPKDDPNSFLYYEVQVSADPNFTTTVMDDVTSKVTLTDIQIIVNPSLSATSTYYWRVRAVNTVGAAKNYSAWSKVRSLKTP